jgi:hypothetical protein
MSGTANSNGSRSANGEFSRVEVAVALTEDAVGRIEEVAAACRALGLEHDSTLGGVGVLTGSAGRDDLMKLRTVPGVLAVETRTLHHAHGPFPRPLEFYQDRRR